MMQVMAARLIVDGNNVMGSRPDGWWKDRARAARRIVEQLGRWAADAGEDVVVVFDGREPDGLEPPPPRVDVRFATRSGPDAADDDIAALVERDADPAGLPVVTSDRTLAERVRRAGAEVFGAGDFRRKLDG